MLVRSTSSMLRCSWPVLIGIFLITGTLAQSPTPPGASPGRPPTPIKSSPTPSPSPAATPTERELINGLNQADLQAAITLLKNNFTNADALSEVELNRALVEGLITRLGQGATLLPARENAPAVPPSPFYSEILEGHIGYLRLGALNAGNLPALDKALAAFSSKNVDAMIVDLRASAEANDFAIAADFAKRFCPKGKPLFRDRKSVV